MVCWTRCLENCRNDAEGPRMEIDRLEYRRCYLETDHVPNGFQVRIVPSNGTKVPTMQTMVFERRDDALAEARRFIDSALGTR